MSGINNLFSISLDSLEVKLVLFKTKCQNVVYINFFVRTFRFCHVDVEKIGNML